MPRTKKAPINRTTKDMLHLVIQNQNDINVSVAEMRKDVKDLKDKVFKNSNDIAYGKGVGKVVLILIGMASFIFGVIQYIIGNK